MKAKKWFWTGMESLESKQPFYRKFVQTYAACCTFADASSVG